MHRDTGPHTGNYYKEKLQKDHGRPDSLKYSTATQGIWTSGLRPHAQPIITVPRFFDNQKSTCMTRQRDRVTYKEK